MITQFTRRGALRLGLSGLVAPALLRTASAAAEAPVLVELFTSQGCSDCPPADKLAGELAGLPGVQVVSLNVDYWDYLGWHDTLGRPEYSRRQQDYAKARGDGEVYTPQMVINGERHVVGSNRPAVEAAIAAARLRAAQVPVSVATGGGMLDISVGALAGENGTLWVMGIAPQVNVTIARGENAGASLAYHNVVRRLIKVGSWAGAAQGFKLAETALRDGECKSCVAVLQQGQLGRVLGLASLTLS